MIGVSTAPKLHIEGQRGCYYGYIIASTDKSRQSEVCVANHAPEGSCTPMPSAFRFARYQVRGCLLPILGAMVQVEKVAVHGVANRQASSRPAAVPWRAGAARRRRHRE